MLLGDFTKFEKFNIFQNYATLFCRFAMQKGAALVKDIFKNKPRISLKTILEYLFNQS